EDDPVLVGDGPTYFNAVIKIGARPSGWLDIEASIDGPSDWDSMFICVAQLTQLPERISPKVGPALVWLKFLDERNRACRHISGCLFELLRGVRLEFAVDGKADVTRGRWICDQRQLPSELVQA